ncbi:cx9C motif-containing protein 4 [Teleopsis dalmanni]|uniref:cx9C motif-containing protein 4 n=1 Tax=Teleopsis dalmanni TaxID=139649 RepID=UPI0018CD624A|nr:cx9C motif-containing protein 4 [Teleopsis dalmanni]
MTSRSKDPCKKYACRIQVCLQENQYQESKCQDLLEDLRLCCVKWHKESVCCSGIDLSRNYLQTQNSNSIVNNAKISNS